VSDEADFLRAICLHPDDDAPRLIFADWLDENGQPERAEFIRSQIVCSKYTDCPVRLADVAKKRPVPMRCGRCEYCVHRRQSEGLAHRIRIIEIQSYAFCLNPSPLDGMIVTGPGITLCLRRGFIDEIHCTLAEFMVHAQTIALTHPVRKWVLTDVREYQGLNGVSLWDHETFAIKSPEPNMRSIPRSLFRYLRRGKRFKADRGPIRYKSSALAIADLQQACYHYAREGLLASIKAPATPLAG